MSTIRKHAILSVMVGIAAFLLLIAAGASSVTAARTTHAAPAPATAIGEQPGAAASTCAESAAVQSLSNKPCRTCSGKPYCTCTYNGQPRVSCEPCCYRTFNGGETCLD